MTSVIDAEQLKMMTAGDSELAVEVIGIFRSQVEMWGALLDPRKPEVEWADACHTIKGAARSIGAMQLGDACEKAENAGREGGVSAIRAGVLISEVRDRLIETMEALADVEFKLASRSFF